MGVVLVNNERDPVLSAELRRRGHEPIAVDAGQLPHALAGADAVYANPPTRITASLIAGAPRLRVVAAGGAGLDHIDVDAAAAAGVTVVDARGVGSSAVAEHTLGAMIALAKQLLVVDRAVRAGDFGVRWRLPFTELHGKTLGIVGYGHIGRAIAVRARAFDMTVLATRAVALDDLLRRSDYVSVNVPLTAATRGLLGARELALMKPTAFLVDTSRGGVVDEAALHAALAAGRLAGAAIDVFAAEPAPPSGPLLELPNVIVTAHCAGITQEVIHRMARVVANTIADILDGFAVDVTGPSPNTNAPYSDQSA
ncbi:MAG TPA: NAD(P)-dependent oxidoreductase [Acidimicrobiales bacterium]|nr:NAD(P)-dependent oxidoreductase [Acidimicrobiales bacterium]